MLRPLGMGKLYYSLVIRSLPRITCSKFSELSAQRHYATLSHGPGILSNPLDQEHEGLGVHQEQYGRNLFEDRAQITVRSGAGGHGCVSFLREKYLEHGPPNGGDGGTGGSIYIQAVKGETSLHKLARRPIVKANRGMNGQGKSKGGLRGEDVVIQVPVGTVVKELDRHDPMAEEDFDNRWQADKWILYPGASGPDYNASDLPKMPTGRRASLTHLEAEPPISLDLSKPMKQPILLAAGATGGLGNQHFVSRSITRPKIATRGDPGISMTLKLELKILADLGFVGMPNAGKSTLLRAISRSRARVGDWAFTTIRPNIGTMILDDHRGRPNPNISLPGDDPQTRITVADIPGLVQDAHLDKGLGHGFLRHIERAKILAFVVDLSRDPIKTLKVLWNELVKFEDSPAPRGMGDRQPSASSSDTIRMGDQNEFSADGSSAHSSHEATRLGKASINSLTMKPWFVVGTKADLDDTENSFKLLQDYLQAIQAGHVVHPCGTEDHWKGQLAAIPVSAVSHKGFDRISEWTASLLVSQQ